MRFLFLCLPALAGCASVSAQPAPPLPLGRDIRPTAIEAPTQVEGPLVLRDALALALAGNPDLHAAAAAVKAQSGRAVEAGLLPNPELSLHLEDFGGSGAFAGWDNREATIQLSQLVELGGARWSRHDAAKKLREAAAWEYEARRLDVIADTMERFVAVLAAQETLDAAREAAAAASTATEMVAEQVLAGRKAPIEATRSRATLAEYEARVVRGQAALEATRARLAQIWGGAPEVSVVAGNLEDIAPPPSLSPLLEKLTANPLRTAQLASVEAADALVATARRERIPSLRLSGGYRDYGGEDHAFVAGVALPLPLFNQNQGAVAVAEAERTHARTRLVATESALSARLTEAHAAMQAAWIEAESYRAEVLPATRSVAEGIAEGYAGGKFGQLDLLAAQQAALAARIEYIGALAAWHRAAAEVQGLTGTPLFDDRNTK